MDWSTVLWTVASVATVPLALKAYSAWSAIDEDEGEWDGWAKMRVRTAFERAGELAGDAVTSTGALVSPIAETVYQEAKSAIAARLAGSEASVPASAATKQSASRVGEGDEGDDADDDASNSDTPAHAMATSASGSVIPGRGIARHISSVGIRRVSSTTSTSLRRAAHSSASIAPVSPTQLARSPSILTSSSVEDETLTAHSSAVFTSSSLLRLSAVRASYSVIPPLQRVAIATEQVVLIQRRVRGFLARRRWRRILHRRLVAREILSTEQTYLDSLRFLINEFMIPLQTMQPQRCPLTRGQMKDLFSEIQVIAGYNGQLLSQLEKRITSWNVGSCIGDIFTQPLTVQFFKVYTQYVNNYDTATETLDTMYKTAKFTSWLEKRSKKAGLDNRLNLAAYLILPVQRIPRYVLLLQEILKATPEDHADHHMVVSALEKMRTVADYVNSRKAHVARLHEVIRVQQSLIGFNDLVTPGRSFVREEAIAFKASEKVIHRVFLFSDVLLLTRRSARIIGADQYKFILLTPLRNMLATMPDKSARCLRISSPEQQALLLYFASDVEASKWQEVIATTVDAFHETYNLDAPTNLKRLQSKADVLTMAA